MINPQQPLIARKAQEIIQSAKTEDGWTFFEVSIEPLVEQIADENGEPMEGNIEPPRGGEYSDEFGDELYDYPDAMFYKFWSVLSWARDDHGEVEYVDGENHLTYDAAIAHAKALAQKYNVPINHRH